MYHHAIPGQTSFVFNFPRKSLIKRKNKDIFGLPERPSAGSENVDTPELNSLIKMHINCGAQQQWVFFLCFVKQEQGHKRGIWADFSPFPAT